MFITILDPGFRGVGFGEIRQLNFFASLSGRGLGSRRGGGRARGFFGDLTFQVLPHFFVGFDDFLQFRAGDHIRIAFPGVMGKPDLQGGGYQ